MDNKQEELIMAKPIEATPILNEEEWNAFMKSVHDASPKPLRLHSINLKEIRQIMSKRRLDNGEQNQK
jgi:hypothetical protein